MEFKEIQKLGRLAYTQSLKPLQERGRMKHALIFGFDTEFDSDTGDLLSRQYSFRSTHVFKPVQSTNVFNLDQLISDVKEILTAEKVNRNGRRLTIFLGCYYSLAELSKIDKLFEDPRVSIREYSQTLNVSNLLLLTLLF